MCKYIKKDPFLNNWNPHATCLEEVCSSLHSRNCLSLNLPYRWTTQYFSCMFCSDVAALSHLLPAVKQQETPSGLQPFFSAGECLQRGLCINYVQLWPERALPLMQRWLCVPLSHSHRTRRGLHLCLADFSCQSYWEATHSPFYNSAVVLIVTTRLAMQRWKNCPPLTCEYANQAPWKVTFSQMVVLSLV